MVLVLLQVSGVYCSGPDRGSKRECRVRNDENCDVTPCFNDVTCVDFPEENSQYLKGSYCGPCPPGFAGNGRQCEGLYPQNSLCNSKCVEFR